MYSIFNVNTISVNKNQLYIQKANDCKRVTTIIPSKNDPFYYSIKLKYKYIYVADNVLVCDIWIYS